MNLSSIHSVYFIGIGGIGMSALARWFWKRGIKVAGYDRVETPLTRKLVAEGIAVHYEDKMELVSSEFLDPAHTLVVYTPAVPETHSEFTYFLQKDFQVKKRSEVLGIITKDHYTVAVGGTHGKTTTSSMVAHLLAGSEKGTSAFVGGIMTNYESNLIMGGADAPVVAEADEFDRSFLRLFPDHTILTSLDPDHLDIYGDEATMLKTYKEFLSLNHEAKLILHIDTVRQLDGQLGDLAYQSFGLEGADITAANLSVQDGFNLFDYHGSEKIEGIHLQLPGYHNISNALAAITVALDLGMTSGLVKERMASYRGVKRRFEYIHRGDEGVYIDDYAHHPTEIEALLNSVRFLYPGKKVTAIFQPHLYSRTRDFQEGFSQSLSIADEVIMLPIYPAREAPIAGVNSKMILESITTKGRMMEKQDFPNALEELEWEVLLTVGAGDIDQLVPRIRDYLVNQETIER